MEDGSNRKKLRRTGCITARWDGPEKGGMRLTSRRRSGGESGIRTHGSFESPDFKAGSLDHSDISPYLVRDAGETGTPWGRR